MVQPIRRRSVSMGDARGETIASPLEQDLFEITLPPEGRFPTKGGSFSYVCWHKHHIASEPKMNVIDEWRRTSQDLLGGALRLITGLVFLLAGLLKIAVPSLGAAFSGQLSAASIPLPGLVNQAFPVVEAVLGILLLIGLHTRIAALIAALSMVVATYVHLVVEDPALFPLQPVEPVGPLVLIALLLYSIFRGAGSWSVDLRESVGK